MLLEVTYLDSGGKIGDTIKAVSPQDSQKSVDELKCSQEVTCDKCGSSPSNTSALGVFLTISSSRGDIGLHLDTLHEQE